MPNKAVKALMIHELAHVELMHGPSFTKKETSRQERESDMLVIKLGHGDDLISFHRWHNRKYKKYKKNDGLTLIEVMEIMKSNSC